MQHGRHDLVCLHQLEIDETMRLMERYSTKRFIYSFILGLILPHINGVNVVPLYYCHSIISDSQKND
jgi:hypothetical protein